MGIEEYNRRAGPDSRPVTVRTTPRPARGDRTGVYPVASQFDNPVDEVPAQQLRHDALLYPDLDTYRAEVTGFVRAGLAAAEPVLVAAPEDRLTLVAEALGPAAADIELVDMIERGRNPNLVIPTILRAFLDRHGLARYQDHRRDDLAGAAARGDRVGDADRGAGQPGTARLPHHTALPVRRGAAQPTGTAPGQPHPPDGGRPRPAAALRRLRRPGGGTRRAERPAARLLAGRCGDRLRPRLAGRSGGADRQLRCRLRAQPASGWRTCCGR